MKKQFVVLMTILGISTTLTGCSSPKTEELPSIEITTDVADNTESSPETDDLATETEKEEISTEDEAVNEEKEEVTNEEQAENKDETKPVETSKPSTNTDTATKPDTTKPSSNTSSNSGTTTKPEINKKPETNTSSGNTLKPTPSPSPEVVPIPSPTPEVKPEPTPEETPETTSLSSSEVFAKITEGIELPANMDVDDTLLKDLYGIDSSLLEDYCIKMPMMSFSITEIGVFKVKDVNNISSIINGINQRANNVGQMLYPSLQETFDSRIITSKENYILFAMAENASTIKSNFNSVIK